MLDPNQQLVNVTGTTVEEVTQRIQGKLLSFPHAHVESITNLSRDGQFDLLLLVNISEPVGGFA
jgi:hypothetical protein